MKKRQKMENLDDAIVIAEDTSKNDKTLKVWCATCINNEKKVNWQNHAKDPEHIMTFQRFKAIFDIQGEKLRCTVCDTTLKWKALKMHAAEHKILPWHEPNDRYQNFFKNHIFQWVSNFYCYPCDKIFTDWCSAFEHLSWSTHRECMEMELHGNLTLLLPSGEVTYKCCINNGVFAWGIEVGCKVCNLTNIGQQNIGRHICGPEHKTLKSAITRNLMTRIVTANASKCSSTTYAEKNIVARSNGENASRDYPKKNSNERDDKFVSIEENARCCDVNFLCKICNIHLIGKKTLEAHLTEDRHAKYFEKYGCEKISLREGTTYRHTNSLNISTETRKPLSCDPIVSSLTNGLKNSATKSVSVAPKCEMNLSKKLLSSTRLFGDLEENSRGEKICCPICGDALSSAVKLHAHLAKHFSATFSRSREFRKTNEKKIVKSSLEAIFDNNGKLVNTGLAMDGKKTFAKREETIINVKNVLRQLDFKSDFIYEMRDKIIDIELSMKLFFTIDANTVYCFVCQKIIESTQSLFDHLQSLDHCTYLDKIENDHRLFADFPDQFSALDLALEYMEEITDDTVRCRACERRLYNVDRIVREHIDGKKHKNKCEKTRTKAKENFELVKPKVRCDWYRVQRYWCVLCFKIYRSEVNFVKHLGSDDHAFVMETRDSRKRKMILKFCEPCALLWYGYRCTYAYHCDISSHLWLVRDRHYASNELPEAVSNLLISLEDYVENQIKYYNEISTKEREKEKTLFRDIEDAVKSKFPRCKACPFGSRVSGLGSPDSDIDVFLDCGNMYDGNASSMEQISKFMIDVHECLSKKSKSWDVDEILPSCRSPIIKARHRVTGLSCDISFENGLAVENTKLIKSFNDFYPSCRKMILFLKQWLTLSGLTGSQGITSYALSWCVIFFLQKESILPSVARLIAKNDESHTIAGWQVGVDRNFTYSNTENNFSLKNLLVRFFTFYANFEFRYEIACPVLGKAVKKRVFADPKELPEEMAAYIAYVENTDSPVPFRIDSPMCIQDPFDLQHNLTKAVRKVYLSRFRNYCSNSLDILCSSVMEFSTIG